MNRKPETTLTDNQPSQPEWTDEAWTKVKSAIVEKWPHLDERDVESVPCDVYQIEDFLAEFTNASADEIQSVVREFAPSPSVFRRASHLGEQVGDQVGPPVHSAIERVQYEVDEHRGTVGGVIFVTGLALGVLAATAFFKSRPQPSPMESYLPHRWRA
ncbi:hypothetical protein FF011L_29320 [Roseimaritima multifibrata]|uniref:Uncharacterized protein n=1 Tax=Roseimaritima multifibrata TaxID=1930274 RepID=A0A517MGZ6_9BACT|nr:hypothetical protein [Roseimaritima multifibrata]QDS94154.1 hypothetical protein FF011L_29320 [Roseimaritima multifibrata]